MKKNGYELRPQDANRTQPNELELIGKIFRHRTIRRSLEIGFASGESTLKIIKSLPKDGLHIAIDPHERTTWKSEGLKKVGDDKRFRFIESRSDKALPRLRSEEGFDYIYIDGNHRFDDVLVDFYLSDRLLSERGIMHFDDTNIPSVRKVLKFILNNRKYRVFLFSRTQNKFFGFVQDVINKVCCGINGKFIPLSGSIALEKFENDNNVSRPWGHFRNF